MTNTMQVLQKLRSAAPFRRTVALALLNASLAYVRATRVASGTALQYATTPRPLWALMWAGLVSEAGATEALL